jgi:hypothetical protein
MTLKDRARRASLHPCTGGYALKISKKINLLSETVNRDD